MVDSVRFVSTTVGQYAANRQLKLYLPRVPYASNLRMVQFCHGYTGSAIQFQSAGIIEALVNTGRYLPFSADQGGSNLFGGAGVATDIEAANTWVAAKFGARTDKFAMFCYSMGFINGAQEVYANASKIPAIVGVAPLTNGTNVYADGAAGIKADMDASAGGSWATVDAARSPAQNTGSFSGIHVECWQGTSDTTIRPADTSTFCTAVGGTYHPVAGDHTSVFLSITASDIVAALDAGNWT